MSDQNSSEALKQTMASLDTMSMKELTELYTTVGERMKALRLREEAEAKSEIRAIAARVGLTVTFNDGSTPSQGGRGIGGIKLEPKYRHPEDSSLEWSGHGRQPKWVKDWLASGKTLEAIAIK